MAQAVHRRTFFRLQYAVASEARLIHRYIFHNEKLVAIEDSRLSMGQAGLICGWGLFTTLRVAQGEAFAYERHWRRLEEHAVMVRLPMACAAAKVRMQLQEVLRKNQVTEGCARIYLVHNSVGSWQSNETKPQVDLLICSAPLPQYAATARLAVREHGRHAAAALSGVKSISWLNNVWALAEATKEGFDEVVLLNERQEVAECTSANIFAVKNGKVLTPPLSSGCLAGVTRSILMEIAPETGTSIAEKPLKLETLYTAEEVFISSTNRGLLGVSEIAGHAIARAPGPVTTRLAKLFASYIGEYVTRRRSAAVR
jgi:branched-chain amino acid aminotransferase